MIGIELVEVEHEDRALLDRLAQLYQYDFSEFDDWDVAEDGSFHVVDFDDAFAKDVHHAYLVRVDGKLAGFVVVYEDAACRDPNERLWWVDQFFVMRKYRRRGVGEHIARELFDRLGGTWEVGQVPSNTAAQAFWRTVIHRYTEGGYEEFEMSSDEWRGPVQYFRTGR